MLVTTTALGLRLRNERSYSQASTTNGPPRPLSELPPSCGTTPPTTIAGCLPP